MALKILQLISSAGFFGAESVLLELSSELNTLRQEVTIGIFNNSDNPNLELMERANGYNIKTQIFNCNGKFDWRTVLRIASFVKSNSIDIVHSHGYKSDIYAALSSFFVKKPLVSTCHNWINSNAKIHFYAFLDKLCLKSFDAIAPVSQEVCELLLASGIRRKKITLIENGINVRKFQADKSQNNLRKEFGLDADSPIVGTVGRLSQEKGHSYFLEAASMIVKKKECTFIIVGDGPLHNQLKEQAKALNISDRVIFAGRRSDIPELLSLMEIFVLPSLIEAQPMALFEAMASKKPIVATEVGSIPRILKNGLLGIIIPPRDPHAITNGVLAYLDNLEKANTRGVSAFKEVAERYSSARMAEEYLRVYKTCCNEGV